MLWNEVIELGQATETITNWEPIRTYAWTQVFADKRSVKRSERANQMAIGVKPELIFTIRTGEFSDHEKVRYKSKEYFIVSTYEVGDMLELTLTSTVA
jgi:hypothetical protein